MSKQSSRRFVTSAYRQPKTKEILAAVPETKQEYRAKSVVKPRKVAVEPVRHIKEEQVESLMFKCANFA